MNKNDLLKTLKSSRMSHYNYSIDDIEKDQAYHLAKEKDQWLIYYMERGKRKILGTYKTESEACQALHKILKPYL
jgi:hypothetical protein